MKQNQKKKSAGREVLEWILTILVAVVLALGIRTFLFEPVRVEGESMNYTLADGEIMLTSKTEYASVWLTLPWMSDEQKEQSRKFTVGGDPERFDIVICRYPGRGDTKFVKRVVGLPGDTVRLENGYLYVNDELYPETYIADEYRKGYRADFGPITVPENQFFVLGDHRNDSNDSRAVGCLPRENIIGKVKRVVYPFDRIRDPGKQTDR